VLVKILRAAGGFAAALATSAAVALAPAPAPLAKPEVLTVGYVKVGHLAPLLAVAEELKKLKVEVKAVEFVRYADARTALLSGAIDVGAIGPADLIIALSQGNRSLVGLTGVASSDKFLVVRKGVAIKDWKDLAGKRIGIAPGSAVWFQWAATLAEKNIPYSSFNAVNIQGGGTAFVLALKRGDIDAFLCWEPFESQVVADGAAYFARGLEYGHASATGAELGLLATHRGVLATKGEALRRFLWAYLNSEQKLAADPSAFANAYAQYTGLALPVARESAKSIKLGGVLDANQLKRQAAAFFKLGVIQKDVSAEIGNAFDDGLVKALR
jgi:sulfonate transport system substrate-binding protein